VVETQEYGTAADRDVTYRHDLSGRLESVEYPSGLTLSCTYDPVGRACRAGIAGVGGLVSARSVAYAGPHG